MKIINYIKKEIRLIKEKDPDLIISTHPFSTQMVSYLKRKGKIANAFGRISRILKRKSGKPKRYLTLPQMNIFLNPQFLNITPRRQK